MEQATQAVETAATRERGTVRWFDDAKGYGFIQREAGEEIFCHFSSIVMEGFKTLRDGQAVEFTVASGTKGNYAEHVVPLD